MVSESRKLLNEQIMALNGLKEIASSLHLRLNIVSMSLALGEAQAAVVTIADLATVTRADTKLFWDHAEHLLGKTSPFDVQILGVGRCESACEATVRTIEKLAELALAEVSSGSSSTSEKLTESLLEKWLIKAPAWVNSLPIDSCKGLAAEVKRETKWSIDDVTHRFHAAHAVAATNPKNGTNPDRKILKALGYLADFEMLVQHLVHGEPWRNEEALDVLVKRNRSRLGRFDNWSGVLNTPDLSETYVRLVKAKSELAAVLRRPENP